MKSTRPITSPEGNLRRPAAMLPLETYTAKRVREFDQAEEDLAKVLARRKRKRAH